VDPAAPAEVAAEVEVVVITDAVKGMDAAVAWEAVAVGLRR
jgi:hypothetical protein